MSNTKNTTLEETITIPIKEYKSLKEDEAFLAILEENGVDNWGGYDDSVEIFQNEYSG
jgi:uncharacterized secreted protein with C-terminal beta-propeller domain